MCARLGAALPACRPVTSIGGGFVSLLPKFRHLLAVRRLRVALRPAVGEDLEPVRLSPFCKRVGQADKNVSRFPHLDRWRRTYDLTAAVSRGVVRATSGLADISFGTAGTGSTVIKRRRFQLFFLQLFQCCVGSLRSMDVVLDCAA